MKVLIVEDENAAARNLEAILHELEPQLEIVDVLESVSECIQFFSHSPNIDLAFFDIQLSDDIVFKVFDKVRVNCPVVFTTAYNQYAIRAFKVNSIDYILKPVNKEAVDHALRKFKELQNSTLNINQEQIISILNELKSNHRESYKYSFLAQFKDRLVPVQVQDIAYFFIDNGLVYAMTHDKESYILDQKLELIENQVDPEQFFRANRQFIVNRRAVKEVKFHLNGKMLMNVKPATKQDIMVSKLRAPELKRWLGR